MPSVKIFDGSGLGAGASRHGDHGRCAAGCPSGFGDVSSVSLHRHSGWCCRPYRQPRGVYQGTRRSRRSRVWRAAVRVAVVGAKAAARARVAVVAPSAAVRMSRMLIRWPGWWRALAMRRVRSAVARPAAALVRMRFRCSGVMDGPCCLELADVWVVPRPVSQSHKSAENCTSRGCNGGHGTRSAESG